MPILAAFAVPHPPMIVPEVGRGSQAQVEKTISAYRQVAQQIADLKPDTILISSPHATMYMDYFHISKGESARGSFADFRAPQVRFEEAYDEELADQIAAYAAERGFPAGVMGEREKKLSSTPTRPAASRTRSSISSFVSFMFFGPKAMSSATVSSKS